MAITPRKIMALKRPGNSRDDRSSGAPKRPARGAGQTGKSANSRYEKSKSFEKQGDRPKRTYSDREGGDEKKSFSPRRKPYTGRPEGDDRPAKSFDRGFSGERKPYGTRSTSGYGEDRPKRSFDKESTGERKPYSSRKPSNFGDDRPKRSFDKDSTGDRKPYSSRKSSGFGDDRPKRSFDKESTGERKPYSSRKSSDFGDDRPKRSFNKEAFGDRPKRDFKGERSGDRKFGGKPGFKSNERSGDRPYRKSFESDERSFDRREDRAEAPERVLRGRKKSGAKEDSSLIRLNRYISNAGICSRRKADELIIAGVISVNGEVVSELGYKVDPSKDVIRYNGETLKREKMVYVLLNKPKDYITTTDDPQERRTVMQLVEKASKERIYPIGRLDRNTTGLLLMTNDGDLADKLSHPKNNIIKLYQAELSKSLTQGDLNKIAFGLELEDGFIKPDMISYVQGGTKREVGIQIHSGKNRIVRRIFEHLGYEVVKLDRTVYASLTKKDLPRGRWRYLDEHEIIQLKHLV